MMSDDNVVVAPPKSTTDDAADENKVLGVEEEDATHRSGTSTTTTTTPSATTDDAPSSTADETADTTPTDANESEPGTAAEASEAPEHAANEVAAAETDAHAAKEVAAEAESATKESPPKDKEVGAEEEKETNDDHDEEEAYDEYTTSDWESRQSTSVGGDDVRSFHRSTDGESTLADGTVATLPTHQEEDATTTYSGEDGSSAFLLPSPGLIPPPPPPSDGTPMTHHSIMSSSGLLSSQEMSGSMNSPSLQRATALLPKSSSLVSRHGSDAMETLTIDKLRFDNLTHLYGRQTQQKLLRDLLLDCIRNSKGQTDGGDGERAGANPEEEEKREDEKSKEGSSSSDNNNNSDNNNAGDNKNTAHNRSLVFIQGPAGCGKTALTQTLSQTVHRHKGFFLTGKFDQQQKLEGGDGKTAAPQQPYQAMAAACQQLVDDLTMQYWEEIGDPRASGETWISSRQSVASLSHWSTTSGSNASTASSSKNTSTFTQRFLEDFQNTFENEQDLALLYSIVPGLPGLLSLLMNGKDEDATLQQNNRSKNTESARSDRSASFYQVDAEQVKDMSFSEAKLRFLNAMTRFVRFLAALGPLVIVLDDLQWADQPSLELLEAIATDISDNNNHSSSSDRTQKTESVTSEGEDKTDKQQEKEIAAALEKKQKNGGAVMILGLYRDNEVEEGHILRHTLRDVVEFANKPDTPLVVNQITIENLTKEDIGKMLSDLLLCTVEQTDGLAELVCQKTGGNAFFARQFLLMLQQQNLLQFNFGAMQWQYDLETVRIESSSTENIVDLLKLKLQKLPKGLQLVLPRVACLGNLFLASMFELVTAEYKEQLEEADLKQQEEDDARERDLTLDSPKRQDSNDEDAPSEKKKRKIKKRTLLQICQKEGLIVDCGQGWCKWEHDRIQEAALSSVEDEKELKEIQYSVGSLLLEKLPKHEVAKALYVVTNLLNAGVDGIVSQDDEARRLVLGKLNLRAGKAAFASSAFSGAAAYLKTGIQLLPEDKWERPEILKLVLDLYSTTAEVQFCLGDDADLLKMYCEEVLSLESLPLMRKRRVYNVKVHALGAEGRSADAKNLVVEILHQLGCKFPKRAQGMHAAAGVTRLRMTIKKTTERLNDLPVTTDEKANWVFFLLDRLVTYAFQSDAKLLPLAMLKGHRWTVMYGTSTYSSTLLCSIALMLSASLGDFEGGKVYAERALELMSRTVEARTLFIAWYFVLHWVTPIEHCKKPLLRGYQVGLESGDLESSFWCVFCYIELVFYQGGSLQKLMDDCRVYCQQMEKYGQAMHLLHTKFLWQLFANLADPSDRKNKHILTGDIMDEDEVLRQIKEANDMHSLFVLNRYRICSAFWFGQYEKAIELIEETEAQGPKFFYEKITPGFCGIGPFYCYCALSCIFVANKSQNNRVKKNKYKKYALGFYDKIRVWVKKGNPNFRHIEALMEAELAAMDGQDGEASKQFEIAILLAGRRGLTGDQALAHHRYGDFWASKSGKETDDSHFHHQRADTLYVDWGAVSLLKSLPGSASDFSAPIKEFEIGGSGEAEPSVLIGLDSSRRHN